MLFRLLCPAYPSLLPPEQASARRTVRSASIGWLVAAPATVLGGLVLDPEGDVLHVAKEALMIGGILLATFLVVLRVHLVREARGAVEHRTAVAKAARLDGVLLAARTTAHRVNNDLVRTVGYCHLVADDPDLPPHLRALVREALGGAEAAVASIGKLRAVTSLEEAPESLVLPPEERTLDLERSAPRRDGPRPD